MDVPRLLWSDEPPTVLNWQLCACDAVDVVALDREVLADVSAD